MIFLFAFQTQKRVPRRSKFYAGQKLSSIMTVKEVTFQNVITNAPNVFEIYDRILHSEFQSYTTRFGK